MPEGPAEPTHPQRAEPPGEPRSELQVRAGRALHFTAVADTFQDPLEFEVVLASLRIGREDADAQLVDLATRLSRALPERVDVERSGVLSKKVRSVAIEVANRRFRIEKVRGQLACNIASVVRGVVIRTDDCGVDAWLAELSRELVRAAEASQETRVALERLLR